MTLRNAILGLFRGGNKPDLDNQVLVHLGKAGADLSKEHVIDFFLYLPTEDAAHKAAFRLRSDGFQTQVERAARGENWLCQLNKTMVPELAALQKIRRELTELASSLGGQYDGWGTEGRK